MRTAAAAFRLQLGLTRRTPDTLHVFVSAPLFTVIFLAIAEHAGRRDLASFSVLAPCLMSLWTIALFVAGDLISQERAWGTLEMLFATPARFPVLAASRLTAVTTLGMFTFAEAWLVAAGMFGIALPIPHPAAFIAVMLASALAMAGTALCVSALFVLLPSARTVQNTVSYPFYLLSGVLVPVAMLPGWIQPVAAVDFLAWSSSLLRDTLSRNELHAFWPRLAVVVVLGLAGYALGTFITERFARRARALGTISET